MGQLYIYGFDASPNIRDLGGYETADGRVVKYQKIIRGVSLASLQSEHDKKLFNYFNFKTVMDLRSSFEMERLPDPEIENVNIVRNPAMRMESGDEIDFSPEGIKKIFDIAKANGINISKAILLDHYYKRMFYNKTTFRKMFDVLLKQEAPLYIHCAAGKDRTGIAAILILLALGVDKESCVDDYNVTNYVLKPYIDKKLEESKDEIAINPQLHDEIKKTYGVDSRIVESELKTIEIKYGSFDRFFGEVYGLSQSDLQSLRQMYTE